MNITSFTSFFKKKNPKLTLTDTILIKKLTKLSEHNNLFVFKDVNIYHHDKTYTIGLIVLDIQRGLYLFETRDWTYDDLKNATIEKAKNQNSSERTLAFDKHQEIIYQKLSEQTNTKNIKIFNYLLMENLNQDEYQHLDDSFQKLLPLEKVIFSDYQEKDILEKLQSSSLVIENIAEYDEILTSLFIQYCIFDLNNDLRFCTEEQILFIKTPLKNTTYLNGVGASGKSSLLLLKSVVELLQNPNLKIIILKQTVLASHILKKKLLALVIHANIRIDLKKIEICTPLELLNNHREELGLTKQSTLLVETKLMQKAFNIADIIMCDDAIIYDNSFFNYLKYIQKSSQLLLVNSHNNSHFYLSRNFKEDNRKISFYQTIPHAKALYLIATLLKEKENKILLVSNSISAQKLKDDLFKFIQNKPRIIDSSMQENNQELERVLFCSYQDVNELQANHIILMDLCFTSINQIEYALNLPDISVHILYKEICHEIKQLRNRYEQSS